MSSFKSSSSSYHHSFYYSIHQQSRRRYGEKWCLFKLALFTFVLSELLCRFLQVRRLNLFYLIVFSLHFSMYLNVFQCVLCNRTRQKKESDCQIKFPFTIKTFICISFYKEGTAVTVVCTRAWKIQNCVFL